MTFVKPYEIKLDLKNQKQYFNTNVIINNANNTIEFEIFLYENNLPIDYSSFSRACITSQKSNGFQVVTDSTYSNGLVKILEDRIHWTVSSPVLAVQGIVKNELDLIINNTVIASLKFIFTVELTLLAGINLDKNEYIEGIDNIYQEGQDILNNLKELGNILPDLADSSHTLKDITNLSILARKDGSTTQYELLEPFQDNEEFSILDFRFKRYLLGAVDEEIQQLEKDIKSLTNLENTVTTNSNNLKNLQETVTTNYTKQQENETKTNNNSINILANKDKINSVENQLNLWEESIESWKTLTVDELSKVVGFHFENQFAFPNTIKTTTETTNGYTSVLKWKDLNKVYAEQTMEEFSNSIIITQKVYNTDESIFRNVKMTIVDNNNKITSEVVSI